MAKLHWLIGTYLFCLQLDVTRRLCLTAFLKGNLMISQKGAIISKILHSNAKMSFVTFETTSLDNKKAK